MKSRVLTVLRNHRNWSLAHVAACLNLQPVTYFDIENGDIKLSLEVRNKIAALYNIPVELLQTPASRIETIHRINYINCNFSGIASAGFVNQQVNNNIPESLISELNDLIKELRREVRKLKKEHSDL